VDKIVKSIGAIIIVALSLGLVVVQASMVPEAKAEILPAPLLHSDGASVETVCSLQGWPHYAPRCQFDLRTGSAARSIVRVIAVR